MAEVKLKAVISAEDKTSAVFSKFGARIITLNQAVNLLRTVFTPLKNAVVSTFEAFQEAQVVTERSLSIFKAMNAPMDEVTKRMAENAKMARQLAFDDEELNQAFAKLSQGLGSVEEGQKKLGLAMDLARFKNISLEESTQALILAGQGSSRMLKQLGIDVEEGASKTEVFGAVQERVKGQSEAFANTSRASMDRLKQSISDAQEKIGAGLAPAIAKLADTITRFVDSEQFSRWLGATLSTLQAIGGTISSVTQQLSSLTKDFRGAQEAQQSLEDINLQAARKANELLKQGQTGAAARIFQTVARSTGASAPNLAQTMQGERMKLFSQGLIPGLAEGGVVTKPTVAMIGERGPEAVVPLGRGGGMGTTININNPVVREEFDIDRIVQRVSQALSRRRQLSAIGAF